MALPRWITTQAGTRRRRPVPTSGGAPIPGTTSPGGLRGTLATAQADTASRDAAARRAARGVGESISGATSGASSGSTPSRAPAAGSGRRPFYERTRTNASAGNPAAAAVSRVSAAVARTARSTPQESSSPSPRRHVARPSTPALAQSAPRSAGSSSTPAPKGETTYRAGTIAAKASKSGAKFESFDKSVSTPAMKNFLATHPWARQSKDKALVKQVVASLLAREKKIKGRGAADQAAAERRFGNF